MPQLLSSIEPDAEFSLTAKALVDSPDLADLVTQIIAIWSIIEQEFQTLFFRIVDPDEDVALALYSTLTNTSSKSQSLESCCTI